MNENDISLSYDPSTPEIQVEVPESLLEKNDLWSTKLLERTGCSCSKREFTDRSVPK